MEPLSEVMKDLPKHIKMDLTSNVCNNHPLRVKKPIYKIMVEGNEVCPVCESAKMSQELVLQETNSVNKSLNSQSYRVFKTSSLLKDIGLLNASFRTYTVSESEEVNNKQRATSAFDNYKLGKVFNTWFTGAPGVGKSHLAMSILRNLNEHGQKDKSCLFISVDEMLLKIRDSFNNKESKFTEHYFVDLLSTADYLVLDDLGAETGGTGTTKKATDFTLRVLYSIANARQSKSTIVTTNLSRTALENMYDQKLVSRLMKDTYLINFTNTLDKRIKNIEF